MKRQKTKSIEVKMLQTMFGFFDAKFAKSGVFSVWLASKILFGF